MIGTDNQSAQFKTVIGELEGSFNSKLATPQQNVIKQPFYSDTPSELGNDSVNDLGNPQKYLKKEEGAPSLNISINDNTFRTPVQGHQRPPVNLGLKENVNPGFLPSKLTSKTWKKKKLSIESLTPEEGKILLSVWEKNYFIAFNSWLQIAKAKMTSTIKEIIHIVAADAERTYKTKSYQCHLKLFFNFINEDFLFANGVGKSKKEARKMATKQIVTNLIQKGMIILGLKDKSFLYKDEMDKNSVKNQFRCGNYGSPKVDKFAEERDRRLKREIKRLNKKMHQSLREDSFVEACQYFCQIICNKTPEWNEVSQIWSYVVLKREPKYAKIILDLLQYKRVKKTITEQLEEETNKIEPENHEALLSRRSGTQNKLKYLYGFGRIKCENMYDIIDIPNFNNVEPEGVVNPEGMRSYQLTDPETFMVTMDDFNNKLALLGVDELGDLLDLDDEYLGTNTEKNFTKEFIDDERGLLDYDPALRDIKIDQTTQKEKKDPNINYVDFKLLGQMYEMLVFSGDMNFSVQVSEMLYIRTRLSDEEFNSPYAAYYYAHRKNMMQIDLIEALYISYLNKNNNEFGFVRLEGKLEKIGYKFRQQVLTFTPHKQDNDNLDSKIVRRGMTVGKSVHDIRGNVRINEQEYILLIGLEKESVVKADPELNELLEEEGGPGKGYHSLSSDKKITAEGFLETNFFKTHIAKGKKARHVMVAFVNDISKDFILKLYTLPNDIQSIDLRTPNESLDWVIVRVPVQGHHYAANQALLSYAAKKCSNPSIGHIIYSPPLTNRKFLADIYQTRANLQIHQSQKTKMEINSILGTLSERVDESQLQAVKNALSKSLSLVHASSISGKFAVIVEIVTAWLQLSTASVLVCAESNMKVDTLHMALKKAGVNSVRLMGSPDNYPNETITPDFTNTVNHFKTNGTYFNAYYIRYPIIKKIISSASVICTTLDALSGEYLQGASFPRVIVDDSSSCFEPLVLSAFTKNCQHAVLFGDHKLLPPPATSEFSISKGIQISLFERLMRQGYPSTFLDYQYLINPSISYFPSFMCYSMKLKSGVDQKQLPLIPGFPWPNDQVGMTIINVNTPEEHVRGSIQNTGEAEIIMKVLMKFLTHKTIDIDEIGILTTYFAQKKLLKNAIELAKNRYPTSFSKMNELGQEEPQEVMIDLAQKEKMVDKELILISTVRSNQEGNVGVLRDGRMLNSMITKGKRGVIIIGNIKTLARQRAWRDLIFWAQSNNIIFNYN